MTDVTQRPTTMLRLPKVRARTGKARSTIYFGVAKGLFPEPVAIGARAVAWPDYEVDAVIAAQIAGKSNDEIRNLVKQLKAARVEVL